LNRNIVLNTDSATQRSVSEEFGILADECVAKRQQFSCNGNPLVCKHEVTGWTTNKVAAISKISKQCSLATGNPMQGIACGQPESVRDTYEIKNVVAREWVPRLSHLQRLL
jgi:hypothetical protein